MELMLTVTSSHRIALGNNCQTVVDSDVYSIGRGVDNSWVLEDPKLHVSNKHCVIHKRNSEYHLTDISTNGVFVNGDDEPIGRGRSVVLKNADLLTIGEYKIKVRLEGATDPANQAEIGNLINAGDNRPGQEIRSDRALHPDELIEPGAGEPVADTVISELLGVRSSNPDGAVHSDHVAPEKSSFIPPHIDTPATVMVHSAPAQLDPVPQDAAVQPIPDDWLNGVPQNPSDTDSYPRTVTDSITGSMPATPDQPDMVVVPDLRTQPALESEPDKAPAIPAADERVADSAVQGRPDDGQVDLLKRIFSAAGINYDPASGIDRMQIAETLGKLLSGYSQGMVEALATRSMVKSEFRLQQTMIRPVDNNPLKFSPSGVEAMKVMLFSDSHAYLPADSAIAEGFFDIQAHQLSMMSGIQAAFSSLLDRFDPEKLEFRFSGRARNTKGFLARNRVDNWLEYKEFYLDVCKLMEDKFQDLFTSEFGRAYEEQLRKLKREKGI